MPHGSENRRLVGNSGTGKTDVAEALGLAACRQGHRVRFFVATNLVKRLEKARKHDQLDRLLTKLDKADLPVST